MKTIRFYKILVIILVLLNLSTIFFLVMGNKSPHPPFGPRKSLIEILELKGENAKIIQSLEKEHFRVKDSLMDQSRKFHEQLFQSFSDQSKDNNDLEALLDSIVENQRETERMTFNYFKQVDALCNEEQKKLLQDVIHHALRHMGGPPPPKK